MLLVRHKQLNSDVEKYYLALKRTRKLGQALLAEYRCAQGCLLLVVFQTARGPAFFRPAYRANSDLSGRQRALQASPMSGPEKENVEGLPEMRGQFGSEDAPGHWAARSGFLAAIRGVSLRCEHAHIDYPKGDIPYGTPGHPLRELVT